MSANVTDEVDADSAWPVITKISEESQRSQMAFELATKERRGLSTACVSCGLGAEEDEVLVWACSQRETVG